MLTIDEATQRVSGYLALPGAPGPALVLLQEWWGLVEQIKGVADELAAAGFVTFVPDLYRGSIADEPNAAERLMMGLQLERTLEDLTSSTDWILGRQEVTSRRIGCVGFCMGGGLALYWPTREPRVAASVVYYGAIPWPSIEPDWDASRAAFLLHYADNDGWATPKWGQEVAAEIEKAGRQVTLESYPAVGHAFCDETRPESYDEAARQLSWERTLRFLREHLG